MAKAAESTRIAVLAPLGRDGPLIAELFRKEGLACVKCEHAADLLREIDAGVGAAIVTEEAVTPALLEGLRPILAAQPAWSDLPMILLSGHGVPGERQTLTDLKHLGNVTVLDRPVQTRTLVSAARAALRARARQYDARDAIIARDRFLAMLGHELRNPLSAIVFAIERLRGRMTPPKEIDIVHRQATHLSRLVEDLLDVSRVTSGKVVLSPRPVDLREVLQRAVNTHEGLIEGRHMHVVLSLSAIPAMVQGDPARLEQIFGNLVSNALKYTPAGGRIDLSLGLDAATGEHVVRVKDSGVGLEPKALERIFELFAQVDTTLDRAQGGMGLGLTLVRSLLTMHGGSIVATSQGLGRGSEFVVRLPRADGVAPAVPERSPEQPAFERLDVVVVEDNADIRDMLKELLEEDGHRVSVAGDGGSGLSLILEKAPDLAIVDIGLPGLDGYQVASRARAQGHTGRLVAMTGYGQPEDQLRATRAGFDTHLTKPVDIDQLRRAVEGRAPVG